MAVSAFIRSKLALMQRKDGKPRFELLDNGDTKCLSVVAARLNNADGCLKYNDIDFQHALGTASLLKTWHAMERTRAFFAMRLSLPPCSVSFA